MKKWSAGLATRASAYRASKWGGAACLIQALRMTIGTISTLIVEPKGIARAAAYFVGASLIPIVLAVAGTRLLRGEGLIWGSAAAATVAFDLIFYFPELNSVQAITAVSVRMVLLVMMLNGVRGALAIRNVDYSNASAE